MQIRSRLTLQFLLLVSTIVLLSFLLVYFFFKQLIEKDFESRLRDKAITSATLLFRVDQIDSALLKVIDRSKRDVLYGESITVYDTLNKAIYLNNDTTQFNISEALLNRIRREKIVYFAENDYNLVGLLYENQNAENVIIAGAVNLQGKVRLSDLRVLMSTLFVLMLMVVALAGWIYSGRALKPMQRVMQQVSHISPVDLSQRLQQSETPDEIGKLIMIFNQMLDRIEYAFRHQKTFVANVSHELKNPLTKITSQLEVTLLNERSREEYQKTVESVLEDIKELNQLSVSLLELARLDREENYFTMSKVRVDEILWEARDKVEAFDPQYKVIVDIEGMPEDDSQLCVTGNAHLMKIAIQNVIENACKFSADHQALVVLRTGNNSVQIEVSNQGQGIDQKDLANIFQPFYRADATSKIKGYGIGLPLSQRIISIHKGTIQIKSHSASQTSFALEFPVAQF